MKLMALVTFSGDRDVDRAALELERTGYQFLRLPDEYSARLAHDLDHVFFEVYTEGPEDIIEEVWERIDTIVGEYGGVVAECRVFRAQHLH
jgi:hypothetical protein